VLEENILLSSYGIRTELEIQMRCGLRGGKTMDFKTLHIFFEIHKIELMREVILPNETIDVELTIMGYILLSN
jgi:hypothetical protein